MDLVSNRQRIGRWLQAVITDLGEEYTPKLALRHITVNDRQIDIATFAPQKLGDDEGVFGDLVRRIGEAIDTDAEGLGGVQRYIVVATSDDHVVARLPLRCSVLGGDSADPDPVESEPPTQKGQVAQLMRHNEALLRMFVVGMGQVVSTMQRTIARLQQNVDTSDDRRLAAVEAKEKLLNQQTERELVLREQADEATSKRMTLTLMAQAISTALGLWGNKGGAYFISLFKQFLSTLTPGQWDFLGQVLTKEQEELFQKMSVARGAPADSAAGAGPQAAGGAAAGIANIMATVVAAMGGAGGVGPTAAGAPPAPTGGAAAPDSGAASGGKVS
jgi:hypothetical protein